MRTKVKPAAGNGYFRDQATAAKTFPALAAEDPVPVLPARNTCRLQATSLCEVIGNTIVLIGATRQRQNRLPQRLELLFATVTRARQRVYASDVERFASQVIPDPGQESLVKQ